MTELDELRRIAYGRTSSPAEEEAAAAGRAALAERLNASLVEAIVSEPVESEGEPVESDSLTIVDVNDEGGFVRRLVANRRVWAGPASVAFVLGIVLTVASGVLLLNWAVYGDGQGGGTVITIEEPTQLPSAGDLEAAMAVLARPRESKDVIVEPISFLDSDSTRLLRSMSSESAYAAMSTNGEICLVVVSGPVGIDAACVPPSAFPAHGITVTHALGAAYENVSWDGVEITQTAADSRAG